MKLTTVLLLVGLTPAAYSQTQVIYVDDSAGPGGDGSDWLNAIDNLHDALEIGGAGAEFRVAEGVYLPEVGPPENDRREARFYPPVDAVLRGGYAGDPANPDLRDPAAYPTILSGDLGVPGDSSDNAYRIVYMLTGVLDGFIVEGGRADGYEDRGAGVFADDDSSFIDCTFRLNHALEAGAAIFADSDATVLRCHFHRNTTDWTGWGGALTVGERTYLDQSTFVANSGPDGGAVHSKSWAYIADCEFVKNHGMRGGAFHGQALYIRRCDFLGNTAEGRGGAIAHIHSDEIRELRDCLFVGNEAGQHGGAIWGEDELDILHCRFHGNVADDDGGAIKLQWDARIVDCVFTGNHSNRGGGLYVGDHLDLVNCVLFANSADSEGGGIYYNAGHSVFRNTILWENSAGGATDESAQFFTAADNFDIGHCLVQGWTGALGGSGNSGSDPLFADSAGADGIPGTPDDDLQVRPLSPALDAGDNDALPSDDFDIDGDDDTAEELPFDLLGNPRRTDAPWAGGGQLVDIGPFEFPGCQASNYCIGGLNSGGTSSTMRFSGTPSLSTNDLVLEAQDATPLQSGLFLYGAVEALIPWGDGFLCVAPPLVRLDVISGDQVGHYTYALDLNSIPKHPDGSVIAGSTWLFQLWYRDPGGPGLSGFNTSDGLRVTFCE